MSNPQHPAGLPAGKEHIPIYPAGFIAIRYVQLVLAVLILALAAYGLSYLTFDGNSFILAVAVLSMLTSVYYMIAHYGPPAAYNYWAILGLEIFNVIMWLCSFALLASEVAPVFSESSYSYNSYTGRYTRTGLTGLALTLAATQMTAAALGGVEFILYITSLTIHSIRLHRHRAAGLHCMPPSASSPGGPVVVPSGTKPPGGGGLPMYQQPYPQQQPIPAYLQQQQQQQYPPQGYPPQQQPQGYPPQVYPMPMPMPIPGQQVPQPQQGFYAPVPGQQPTPTSPSPATVPASIVPQPTGGSQATSMGGHQQQQQQPVQPIQQAVPPQQLPAN